jgi:hypothetical protein
MPFSRLCTNTATLGTRTEKGGEIESCHLAFSDPLNPGLKSPLFSQRGSFERLRASRAFEACFL